MNGRKSAQTDTGPGETTGKPGRRYLKWNMPAIRIDRDSEPIL
jgi:hypothetical protein